MNQKKLSYLGLFAAVAIIFGYVESLIPFFAGIPGMKLGLANLADPLHSRKIYMERSCSCFHRPYHRDRIYVWKPVQHSLQPRGRCTQPRSYDFHEEKIRIQHPRHQCCRRCFPQHRSAHHCRSYHDDFRTDLLCTGTFDLRCHYRTSHRNTDKRGTETYPLLNNTKNAEY